MPNAPMQSAAMPNAPMPRRALLALAASVPFAATAAGPSSVADPTRFVLTEPLPMPGLERERRLRIYLPPSYASARARRYPVLYFHDGQNVFDGATSFSGEWGADEALDQFAATRGVEALAVAIDNGGEHRIHELNPWDHERFGAGEGWAYLRFVVEGVKPFIDRHYRTRPGAAHTALVGSSMGGLITHAALHRYRRVFGLGGVLSPSFWLAPAQALALAQREPLLRSQRVLLYAGGKESEEMLPDARRMAALLRKQSRAVAFVEEPDAGHNEAAWRAVLPRVLAHWFAA